MAMRSQSNRKLQQRIVWTVQRRRRRFRCAFEICYSRSKLVWIGLSLSSFWLSLPIKRTNGFLDLDRQFDFRLWQNPSWLSFWKKIGFRQKTSFTRDKSRLYARKTFVLFQTKTSEYGLLNNWNEMEQNTIEMRECETQFWFAFVNITVNSHES